MATGLKTKRIAVLVLAVTATIAIAYNSSSYRPRPVVAETCTPIPLNIKFMGPARTIAQVEQLSLAEMKEAPPSVPRVPFGHLNSEWLALKRLLKPGDTVHEFRTELSGGELVLRGECLVGQLPTWIR